MQSTFKESSQKRHLPSAAEVLEKPGPSINQTFHLYSPPSPLKKTGNQARKGHPNKSCNQARTGSEVQSEEEMAARSHFKIYPPLVMPQQAGTGFVIHCRRLELTSHVIHQSLIPLPFLRLFFFFLHAY